MQLTRMFELSASAAPPKLSVLRWLAVACLALGVCIMLAARGYSLTGTLLVLAGNIISVLDSRQQKELQFHQLSLK